MSIIGYISFSYSLYLTERCLYNYIYTLMYGSLSTHTSLKGKSQQHLTLRMSVHQIKCML